MPTTTPQAHRFFANLSRQSKVIAFVAVFGILGAAFVAFSHANPIGTLSLTPSSATIGSDGTLAVTIMEDSGSNATHAVQADLTYDQTKLQFVSIDTSTSAFKTNAQDTGGNGKVSVVQGSTTAVTGANLLAKVNFKSVPGASGSTSIQFAKSSAIVADSDNSNLLGTTTGGTYTLADTTAPTTPQGLTLIKATVTAITFSWTASTDDSGVASYNIYRNGTKIGSVSGTSLVYQDKNLRPGNNYTYSVTAVDAAGNESPQSTSASFGTPVDSTAPSAPTGLTSPAQTATSISLSWTAASDNDAVAGYNIYRNGTLIGTSTGTTYTDNGLLPNTSYSYTVSAYDAANNTSDKSSPASFKSSADTTAPTSPTGVTTSQPTTTSVSISWSPAKDDVGITEYDIYRNGTKVGTVNGTTTTFTDSNLPSGSYTYTVTAKDGAGNESGQSTGSTITVNACNYGTGDLNCDGKVNIFDLNILLVNWQSTTAGQSQGDINKDGVVNIFDLNILLVNWS